MNKPLLSRNAVRGLLSAAALVAFLLSATPSNAADKATASDLLSAYGYTTPANHHPVLDNLSNPQVLFPSMKKADKAPAMPMKAAAVVNSSVEREVIINEDFTKWTKGTETDPDPEMVTEAMVPELMSYPGDWTLFRMHEAGGSGYMDFDMVGDDGPGYIMSPGIDLIKGDKDGYYRFACRVKNVNANNQSQGLQAFIMDAAASSILSGSTQPLAYDEWIECEWIGQVRSELTQFMAFGWGGEVLIDRFTVEKLIFPLDTPVVNEAHLNSDGSVTLTWDKVDNATSYTIEVSASFLTENIAKYEVGNVTSVTMDFDTSVTTDDFIFYVTAHNGEEISYPGTLIQALTPNYVGAATALEASDVTPNGFTANWEKADFATKYLVLPKHKHTATADGEEFYILNELFANVPEDADDFNPIQIAPMLGYDGMDLYMSRAGWTSDMAVLCRFAPDMPAIALTNQYAAYGLLGSLTSPVTDFSVGGGKVKVSGMAVSALDDVVMICGFIDESGEMYSSVDFEVTPDGTMFEVEVPDGRADSRLTMFITDSTDGGDMIIIPNLTVSTVLNEGETITVPAETVRVNENVASAKVECEINIYNQYSYAVQGYFSAELMGGVSDYVAVSDLTAVKGISASAASCVKTSAGIMTISNPAKEKCCVYSLDGKILHITSETYTSLKAGSGTYIVKIGDKVTKIICK